MQTSHTVKTECFHSRTPVYLAALVAIVLGGGVACAGSEPNRADHRTGQSHSSDQMSRSQEGDQSGKQQTRQSRQTDQQRHASSTGVAQSTSTDGSSDQKHTLLPGHRVITGKVEAIKEDHAKVESGDTGEISPRYLSLERGKEKGVTLKEGDMVEIVVNAKNHVVDYHVMNGGVKSDHRIIRGKLAQPLKVGQETAIIKNEQGEEQSFPVRPLARSEVAAIPFDAEGLFLIDESDKIASATLTNNVDSEMDWGRSTAYNVYRHVQGVVKQSPDKQSLTIQTKDDQTVTLPVWDYLKQDLSGLSKGMQVTVLIDRDDKVVDIAHSPQ